ncbi:MAG: Protein GrpE [Candidatus Azambacteria bacterium GW2011_GWB1_42_72]|nr:MAG: Protein GrpE [Candidatus Azambacteria bacterium GW2011_GWB1_42_72]
MNEENNHPSGGHPQGETTKLSELEQCKKQSEEYLNGWKRAKADYLNLKKDMEQQGREIKEWMSKMFILPLLEIMDNFDRAGTLDAGIERDESGVVAEEKQKGYLMKGEVLRPAKVKVYK